MVYRSDRYTLEDILGSFYMENNRIFKVGHSNMLQWSEDRDVTDQVTARLTVSEYGQGEKIQLHLIRYVLLNNELPIGKLFPNDDGEHTDVEDESIMVMLAYKRTNKVFETTWSKEGHANSYYARWLMLDFNRDSRSFNTEEEAKEYQVEMMKAIWGDTLRELNMYHTYFG